MPAGRPEAGRGGARGALRRLGRSAAQWPPLVRDAAAASLALTAVVAGELLSLALPLPAEVLLALPGVMVAWWFFGAASAAFSLLLAAAAVTIAAGDRPAGSFGLGAWELLTPLAAAAALIASCFVARAWARRRERRAAVLMDACVADALSQIDAAKARVARAEAIAADARARLARVETEMKARRAAVAERGSKSRLDDGFDDARRREGGV